MIDKDTLLQLKDTGISWDDAAEALRQGVNLHYQLMADDQGGENVLLQIDQLNQDPRYLNSQDLNHSIRMAHLGDPKEARKLGKYIDLLHERIEQLESEFEDEFDRRMNERL